MTAPPSAVKTILKSNWDGLNEHLIAKFFEVERIQDDRGRLNYRSKPDGVEVWAPLTEANFEMTLSWNSPFENSGVESKSPTLAAMIQSGALQPMVESMTSGDGGVIDQAVKKTGKFVKRFEGRTGITKLNSTQVFSGMPPVKIPVTALFRAWSDPAAEVEDPVNCLFSWALPVELAEDGSIFSRAVKAARGNGSAVDIPLPSRAPTLLGMQYKGSSYLPLVIESISKPISSPIDSDGCHVSLAVPMVLCSLTAIDRDDWAAWNPSSNRFLKLVG